MNVALFLAQQIVMLTQPYTGTVAEFDASCRLVVASHDKDEVAEFQFRGQGDDKIVNVHFDGGKAFTIKPRVTTSGGAGPGRSYLQTDVDLVEGQDWVRYQISYVLPDGPESINSFFAYRIATGGKMSLYGEGLCWTKAAKS